MEINSFIKWKCTISGFVLGGTAASDHIIWVQALILFAERVSLAAGVSNGHGRS